MIRAACVLASQTLREQARGRALQGALLFSIVGIYMSLILGALAVDQELRALLDFGLSFIEVMAMGLAVYGASTSILREIETKTIYLILSRPVPRASYLLGAYAGLVGSTTGAILAMAAVHVALLYFKGWSWQGAYAFALYGIALKAALAAALALFVALATTSVLSALTITGVVWTLGHFVPEIGFLVRRDGAGPVALPLTSLLHLLPNLQLFNFRDRLDVIAGVPPAEPALWAAGYAIVYGAACLTAAYAFFRTREF